MAPQIDSPSEKKNGKRKTEIENGKRKRKKENGKREMKIAKRRTEKGKRETSTENTTHVSSSQDRNVFQPKQKCLLAETYAF